MNKLKEINGYVSLTLNKLPGIRAVLVRLDGIWQEWDLAKLVHLLERWTDRNRKNILSNDQSIKEKVFSNRRGKTNPPFMCLM